MKYKTKKIIIRAVALFTVLALLLLFASMFTGCARPEDLPQSKRAMITLPNGEVVEGEVDSCIRCSDGWMEIVVDGVIYNVHTRNVVIIEE